jgi:enoyl-CoA hydratase/carnithine racemase
VVVDTRAGDPLPPLGSLPIVVIAIVDDTGAGGVPLAQHADVVVHRDDLSLDLLVERITATPIAATALAVLLRVNEHLPVDEALAAESAVYSTLQGGPEFAAWRASTPQRPRPDGAVDPVRVARDGSTMTITLDRPARHNAYDATMRDGFVGALQAGFDPDVTRIVIRGTGPSFCSGGDLDEFGTRPDPATAHLIRLTRSAGRLIHRLADKVEVELHGWCIGAGIELPAFAGRVRAAPSASIVLPEVRFGLVPGAGGTVSLPRRIGRQRTAWLGLTGATLDASTALAWGLVDALDEPSDSTADDIGGGRPSAGDTAAAR